MKVLIAVASKHGSTHEIAGALSEELQAAHIAVDLRDLAGGEIVDVGNYAAVILGSAIYAGNWLPAAHQFATPKQDALAS